MDLCNPGDVALFRPGRIDPQGQTLRRAWDFSEEGSKLVSGTSEGERLVHLTHCLLNGVKLSVGMWFYFIRSYTNAGSVAKQLEHRDTHVALARLLAISKRVVPATNHTYIHFLFAYKRENGSVRVTCCTKEWVHTVVPEGFQIILNDNKEALLPFTVESKSIQDQLVTVGAKLLEKSEQQLQCKPQQDVGVQPAEGSNTELLEQLVKVKGELVATKAKITEQEGVISQLRLGDLEAKKVVDQTLTLMDDERKAKLAIEAKHKFFVQQQLTIKKQRDDIQEALQREVNDEKEARILADNAVKEATRQLRNMTRVFSFVSFVLLVVVLL